MQFLAVDVSHRKVWRTIDDTVVEQLSNVGMTQSAQKADLFLETQPAFPAFFRTAEHLDRDSFACSLTIVGAFGIRFATPDFTRLVNIDQSNQLVRPELSPGDHCDASDVDCAPSEFP